MALEIQEHPNQQHHLHHCSFQQCQQIQDPVNQMTNQLIQPNSHTVCIQRRQRFQFVPKCC